LEIDGCRCAEAFEISGDSTTNINKVEKNGKTDEYTHTKINRNKNKYPSTLVFYAKCHMPNVPRPPSQQLSPPPLPFHAYQNGNNKRQQKNNNNKH